MKYEVIMENSAERDLLDILTYISKTLLEPATAKRIYLSIKRAGAKPRPYAFSL